MAVKQPVKPAPKKPVKKPRPKSAKQSAKQVDLTARRGIVVELRKQFASFAQIAEHMVSEYSASGEHGVTKAYDAAQAYRDFKHVLADLNEANQDAVEEHRQIDLDRLDAIMAPQFEKAENGDGYAFSLVMEGLKTRAAWFGYNAPVRTESLGTLKVSRTAAEFNDDELAAIAEGSSAGANPEA